MSKDSSPNPVLVKVYRGSIVESSHRASVVVIDAEGKTVLELGNVESPVFPRSAVKAIQALALLESGASEAFRFGDKEIALVCSSHSGQPDHVELARDMLERAGLTEAALECGGHWSLVPDIMRDQACSSNTKTMGAEPSAIWNNCSGKHTGFLCTAAHLGWESRNYVMPDHEVQKNVKRVLEDVTGAAHLIQSCGTDGCSIPTYAISLSAMAGGFAKMATGNGLSSVHASAARRILNACMNEPFFVAGDGRFCTRIMRLEKGRLFAKTGAEGVYCAAIPGLGLGIALKCDDGASRASEALLAATISYLLPDDDELQTSLRSLASPDLHNWNGRLIGKLKSTLPLAR